MKQVVLYDRLNGQIAKRSLPTSENTADAQLLFDEYEYDAMGRIVRHITPWQAMTKRTYLGLQVQTFDPLFKETVTKLDALGRIKTIADAKSGVTSYTYGPWGELYTVTDPGGAMLRTTRDAYGRATKIEDPDKGTTVLEHDGFGELIHSTDSLGREILLQYDELGRVVTRTDKHGASLLGTSWDWDTAAHGLGKLHEMTTLHGVKTYSYDALSRLKSTSLAILGANATLDSAIMYDNFGRVETIDYPAPNGAQPFAIRQEYDPHGHTLAVVDHATGASYWRLSQVDEVGRYQKEIFGNQVTTTREYFDERDALKSILSWSGATKIQNLGYEYDVRGNLIARTDLLQPQNKTERFRYDELSRLTCAYFSLAENNAAPCATSYGYAANGNLISKSDVGALAYTDAAHPHAVTSAGAETFTYNAIGNQITRPGGTSITYTPFDLPRTVTQGAAVTSFGYDGDQRRIRKTTPQQETLYFEELYEQVRDIASGAIEHRYYVHSPERPIAIVMRNGAQEETRYLHVDHLGSVDVVTSDSGSVEERRSYDAFGRRRNPTWGQPDPAAFTSTTTRGFTGHEADDELGLINMRGRVYDPKIARFLTTDPIVANAWDGQAWNGYSYVRNNPLRFVDPSGFTEEEIISELTLGEQKVLFHGPDMVVCGNCSKADRIADIAVSAAAHELSTDVDTTGSAAGYAVGDVSLNLTNGAIVSPEQTQREAGFVIGLEVGLLPFGGEAWQLAEVAGFAAKGSDEARFGLGLGMLVGGIVTTLGGLGGDITGGLLSATAIGSAIGVPIAVASAVAVVGGWANVVAGAQILMSSGGGASNAKAPHGNSKNSEAAQIGYEVTDTKTGEVVKTGVSGGPRTQDGGSVRANNQANHWNRETGEPGRYQPKVVKEVPAGPGARQKILEWEEGNAKRLLREGQLRDKFKHQRPR